MDSQNQTPPPISNATSKKPSSKLLPIVLVIASLIVGIIGGYFIGSNNIGKNSSSIAGEEKAMKDQDTQITPQPTIQISPTAAANDTGDWTVITSLCKLTVSIPPKQAPYVDMEPTPTVPIGSQDPTKYSRYWKYFNLTGFNNIFNTYTKISYGADHQYVDHEDKSYVIIACKPKAENDTVEKLAKDSTNDQSIVGQSQIAPWGSEAFKVDLPNGFYPYNTLSAQTHYFVINNSYAYQIFYYSEPGFSSVNQTISEILKSIKFVQ